MKELKIEYNSTYVSSNLIDELDYVIGGYGKPNTIFIYSLNTFLEAYIFNTNFYISSQELKHIQVISKSIFPNGRPILDLLTKTKSLNLVEGLGNNIGKVVSIIKCDINNQTTYQERIKDFLENGIDQNKAREEYLIIPKLDDNITVLPYLNIGRIDDGFIATVSYNSPSDFLNKLNQSTKGSNIQASLPFYNFKNQIEEIQQRGIGREIITLLSDTFQKEQDKINQYFGFTNQTIPPLVSILLSQCKTIMDIPRNMLQLRQDFTQLRQSIINYEKRINEESTIKGQLDAIDEMSEFWNVFNKKHADKNRLLFNFLEIAEDSNYENSLDKAIDSGNISSMLADLNTGKIIGKGASKLVQWYKARRIITRFRGITNIWSLFEKSPNVKSTIPEFERVFNVKLDIRELQELNIKINQIKLSKKN